MKDSRMRGVGAAGSAFGRQPKGRGFEFRTLHWSDLLAQAVSRYR